MARRFAFRLATLQRVRALREREARRQVGAKRAEIARLDALNAQAAAEIARAQAALLAQQSGAALDPLWLARGRTWVAHLRQTIMLREQEKGRRLKELAVLQDQWTAARRDLRILEKLRERRYAAYQRAQRIRELSEMDEVARRLQAVPTWLSADQTA
jgi:flagellar export protein FliJ